MPRKLTHRAFHTNSPLRSIEAAGEVTVDEISDGSITAAKLAPGAAVPDQSGQSGKYLVTDGTNASWGTVTQTQGMVHGFVTDPDTGALTWHSNVTATVDGNGEDIYDSIIIGTDDMQFTVDDNGHLILTIS
jgi:hypothetical protein